MTQAEIVVEIKKLTNYTTRTGRSETDIASLAVLNTIIEQIKGNGADISPITLATALSSEYDSIDVSKISKGGIIEAHHAITATATSAEIDCRGFNTLSVECAVSAITSGNWQVEVLGCAIAGGTFGRQFDENSREMKVIGLNTNETMSFVFKGIANYNKIKATRTTDGTLTCIITPMNL